jgi:hypothetical protein
MANIENNSEKNDEQRSEFAKNQELKSKVYDAIEEQLIKSTDSAFKAEGIEIRETKDAKGEQGWNRGVYGDGSTYGTGVKKGQGTVTVNRVKGPKSTNGFFEKNLSYGGKKMVVEVHVDIDCESETMDMTYKTTEQAAFRGYQDKERGPYMVNNKQTLGVGDISKFKKEIKKVFDKFADKEVVYFINTKLGIEDRTEKSINSIVEMSNNMSKISLKDILSGSYDETLNKVMESKNKNKDTKINHPDIIDANSPGKLLFDDLDEAEKKHGKDYRDYFEKMMKKYGASSPNELKASEWKTIDMNWKSKEERNIDEITASAGGAGAGAYQTPGAFSKGGDFDDEMKGSKKSKKVTNEEFQKRFEETPYSKKESKRTLKRENKNGWTVVELEPGSGYVPKGMNKNFVSGLHGVDVNSADEDKLSKGSPKGRAAMNEGLDPSKKKFISESEHKELGVNKRYIITHKSSKEEEINKWAKLSNFEKNSTIKIAESCGCPVDNGIEDKLVSREQGELENEQNFMKRNDNIEHGDEIDGKTIVVVGKPGSLSGAEFKVFEEDYLNENKAFILDMNSGNLVNNPNYKNGEVKINKEEYNKVSINENSRLVSEESKIPNTAYYFNTELGRLVRNPNFKS